MEESMKEIAAYAEKNMGLKEVPEILSRWDEYDLMKGRLTMRLVNTKANRHMLSSVPHRKMEDLSLVYRVKVPLPEKGGRRKRAGDQ